MIRFALFGGLLAMLTVLATPAAVGLDAAQLQLQQQADALAERIANRDQQLVAAQAKALPDQRPDRIDLYAIGVAGDGTENVFRNEVDHFVALMRQRFHARGVLTLVSNPDSVAGKPKPLGSYDNLYDAVAGVAAKMDREQDVLLLYLTMHGTPEHELALYFPPYVNDGLSPEDLKFVLDEAGIRNRVLVVSACYSGGFIGALRGPDTLLLTAARRDRTSFGCGADSDITYFGHAWLVDGLAADTDFANAFITARKRIGEWERAGEIEASQPQISQGANIGKVLNDWRAQLDAGPAPAYPHPLQDPLETIKRERDRQAPAPSTP